MWASAVWVHSDFCVSGSSTQTFLCATSMTRCFSASTRVSHWKIIRRVNVLRCSHTASSLASGNRKDERRRESGARWSLLDLLYVLLQSCGELKCRTVPSTLCRPLGKKHSTLNWVSRRWLCALVPSSWNGFHMAGLETFPVGRVKARQLH